MRIISGTYKGLSIKAPANLPVRPTTDFCKESLFNILTNQVNFNEATVLELFAGTGSISYEFLSRGVKTVLAVDNNAKCCHFISTQFKQLNFRNAQCFKADALKIVPRLSLTFDLIFADPPYEFAFHQKLHEQIFENNLLNPGGIFILEHGKETHAQDFPFLTEQRKYGQSILSFFKNP